MSKDTFEDDEVIVLEEWKMPECDIEDYKPVVFFYKDGNLELDFLVKLNAII